MKPNKGFLLSLVLILSQFISAQEIPISKLLYPVVDLEFTLSANGEYMASVKKYPAGYTIIITDLKKG